MESITVKASKTYEIKIEKGLLEQSGALCSEVIKGKKLLLLTDSNVALLYLDKTKHALESNGFTVLPYIIPAGENSKSAENLLKIVSFLAANHFTRADAIVALGGGVIGDLAGFCAATYLRGIGFIQIPTTLLACVDSSVGGKTAVNLPEGKNLFGSFYQPDLVICDPNTLQTLSPAIYADGMAEVIKYGMIWDEDLFTALENKTLNDSEIINRCVTIKSKIVEEDEKDNKLRQILNFGHTIGHAIEKNSNFAISHGSSVAIGMAIVVRALVAKNELKSTELNRLINLLKDNSLPTTCDFDAEALYEITLSDKKRVSETINLITVTKIGKAKLCKLPVEELKDYIKAGLQE